MESSKETYPENIFLFSYLCSHFVQQKIYSSLSRSILSYSCLGYSSLYSFTTLISGLDVGLFLAPGGRPLPLLGFCYAIGVGSETFILFLEPFGLPLPLFPPNKPLPWFYCLYYNLFFGLFRDPFGLPFPLFGLMASLNSINFCRSPSFRSCCSFIKVFLFFEPFGRPLPFRFFSLPSSFSESCWKESTFWFFSSWLYSL